MWKGGPETWTYLVSGGDMLFTYDGLDLIVEADTSGNILRRYVHGPSMDEPLVWYEGAGTAAADRHYLLADERGSIVSITAEDGMPTALNS